MHKREKKIPSKFTEPEKQCKFQELVTTNNKQTKKHPEKNKQKDKRSTTRNSTTTASNTTTMKNNGIGYLSHIFVFEDSPLYSLATATTISSRLRRYDLNFSVLQVAADDQDLFILSTEGHLYFIGSNATGLAGLNHLNKVSQLTRVDFFKQAVRRVFCCYGCAFVIDEYEGLWFIGKSDYNTYPVADHSYAKFSTPQKVDCSSMMVSLSERVIDIAICFSSAVVMTDQNHFYAFGQSYWFNGESGSSICWKLPDFLERDEHVVHMSGGNFHCVILTNKGNCYVNGQKDKRFGFDSTVSVAEFRKMDLLPAPVVSANCYQYTTIVVTSDNQIHSSVSMQMNPDATAPHFLRVDHCAKNAKSALTSSEIEWILDEDGSIYYREKNYQFDHLAVKKDDRFNQIAPLVNSSWLDTQLAGAKRSVVIYFTPKMRGHINMAFPRLSKLLSNGSLSDIDVITTNNH